MQRKIRLIVAAFATVATPALLDAQDPRTASSDPDHPIFQTDRRIMVAERLPDGERVTLDGRLDEAFWARVVPAANFIMQEPTPGGTPTERTEVRIAYDRENLYMGVTNFDSEPGRLMGNTMKRDDFLAADDRFMWTMDTFLDQQTGYFFEMNPSGLMADAVMGPGGSNNREWDGIWDARVHKSEIGWTIEIVIPFRTLNFDPNVPAWGINFQRTVRRKNEESLWTAHERNQGLRRMSNAGLLVGIQDVSQGIGLDVRPYVVARASEAPGQVPASGGVTEGDIGLDLYYNLTPNLRANLTINTDFAETEVDQRQLNLTRFPLQFPEKRSFFLEGGTFFDVFAPPEARPFFSRRIGLDGTGVPQPINGGLKLTGQVGQNDIGALVVRTADAGAVEAETFAVTRMRRRFLTQSYVGGIYTMREGADGAGSFHTVGADLRLITSRFRGSENLDFNASVIATPNPDTDGDNLMIGARIAYPNDVWNAAFYAVEIQRNHNPAVGFLRRREYRGYHPSLTYAPRPANHPYIRRFSFGGSLALLTDLENRTMTRELDITAFRVESHSGDAFTLGVAPTFEWLQRDFQIFPGVVLPGDTEYDFTQFRASVGTASQRIVQLQSTYSWGSFYSGNREAISVSMGLRPMAGVTLSAAAERNQVSLPEGDFTASLYRFVADTQVNPRIYLVNNLQYDSYSKQVGWQARFRWIVQPGNDLFFVYTHNWFEGDEVDRFSTLDRRAATKINYTRRI